MTPRGGEAVYKSEGHPFVRSQNVGLGHLILDDIAYIDEDTHQRQKNTELQLDDVLLNITGASIGRSALVNQQIVGGNVNQHVCIIRANKKLIPSLTCTPKVRQKTFGVLLCLKSTGNMAMQNG